MAVLGTAEITITPPVDLGPAAAMLRELADRLDELQGRFNVGATVRGGDQLAEMVAGRIVAAYESEA